MGERDTPKYPMLMGFMRGLGKYVSRGLQDYLSQDAEVLGRAAVRAAFLAREGKAPGDGRFWVLEPADILKYGAVYEPVAEPGSTQSST